MKITLIKSVSLLAVLMLIFAGCGHLSGNNPVGTTGGSSSGYGSIGPVAGGDGGGQNDPDLFGSWRNNTSETDYEILTFNSDGTYANEFYSGGQLVFSFSGDWETSGSELTRYVNGMPGISTFNVSGDTLTIIEGSDTYIYHRV